MLRYQKIRNTWVIILEKTILDLFWAEAENLVFELKVCEEEISWHPIYHEVSAKTWAYTLYQSKKMISWIRARFSLIG